MTELTAEQIAAIRARHDNPRWFRHPQSVADTDALLSHADALAAKVERLEGELGKATDALTETCDMIKCPFCDEWTDPSSLCAGDGDFEPMCDSCYGAATHECSECSFRPSKPDDFDACPMCEGEIVERPKEDSAHVAHD